MFNVSSLTAFKVAKCHTVIFAFPFICFGLFFQLLEKVNSTLFELIFVSTIQ